MAGLVKVTAPQVKGAHDAEFAIVGDKAFVVAEVNDVKPGESAGWSYIYAALSVVSLKTLAVEKTVSFARSGQVYENETLPPGACFVPRILQKDDQTLRCYFASVQPGKRQSQVWFMDFDLGRMGFENRIHKAKIKTAAGTFDMQPQYFHADAVAQGFKRAPVDSGLYIFDSFKTFDGKIYVALNNFPGSQNALALVDDRLDTFEVLGHYNQPRELRLTESAVNRLPDGTWMAICRQDGGNNNYAFTTSNDGRTWTRGEHRDFVPNGANSKPTFDRFHGVYYLGWQEATKINGVNRSVFNLDISRDGKSWERNYRFESEKSFQYPAFHERNGAIWLVVTQGDTDASRKERIMFGKLEEVGQFASQQGRQRKPLPTSAVGSALRVAGKSLDPLAPPLGLKTYRDLGLMVDDTMLAREWKPGDAKVAPVQKALVAGAWVFPLFDRGNQIKLIPGGDSANADLAQRDNFRTLWCSYSKDAGRTWSEPRFIAALTDVDASIKRLEFRKAGGKSLSLVLDCGQGRKVEVRFKENDLRRLATEEDFRHAPPGRFVLTSVPPDNRNPELLADSLCVGQDIAFASSTPPNGYKVAADVGLLMHESMSGRVLHRAQSPAGTLYETRAVVTPRGDYLVMIPDGQHANAPRDNANRLLGYRSSDRGTTWTGPFSVFGDEAKHHAALPIVSHGGERVYIFGTQRGAAIKPSKGDRAFGFRTSDDDGRSWSPVELVQLDAGKYFGGTGVIQMTETASGTWMVGFHHSRMLRGALQDGRRQWTEIKPATPQQPPGSVYFLDELRVLGLDGANVLALARTCEGRAWEMRSDDDGRTWSESRPTPLVHPDAPPMLFYLSDHRTLIALHHNRAVLRSVHEPIHSGWLTMPSPMREQVAQGNRFRHSLQDWVSRAEVWFSLSKDGGKTWSESRLLFANALAETLPDANSNYQCSYVDLFTDNGFVHFIVPHRWQRVLYLTIKESSLVTLPTKAQLAAATKAPKTTATIPKAKSEPNYSGDRGMQCPSTADSLSP